MEIVKIVIKGASGYGPVDESYEDKITMTASSIKYVYKPHEMSKSESSVYRKWSYKTNSPLFRQIYKQAAEKTPFYLYNNESVFTADIWATEITAAFEDKHREKVNFFCPSAFFCEYFGLIKKMVPETEFTPAVLLTDDDFEDEE